MWAFADTDLRPHHALPSPETWRTLLEELGLFAEIHKPGGDETAAVSGQFVVLARKPARVDDRVWFAPVKADAASPDRKRDRRAAHCRCRAGTATRLAGHAGGRTVTAGDTVDPAQAALWGLANGAAIEHPELRLSIIDSDDRDAALRLIRTGGAETRLAWRNGRAYRARLERCAVPQDISAHPARPDLSRHGRHGWCRPRGREMAVGLGRQVARPARPHGASRRRLRVRRRRHSAYLRRHR